MFFILTAHLWLKAFSQLSPAPLLNNLANSLCEAMGRGKERVAPWLLIARGIAYELPD
jgi:hypothetical protein